MAAFASHGTMHWHYIATPGVACWGPRLRRPWPRCAVDQPVHKRERRHQSPIPAAARAAPGSRRSDPGFEVVQSASARRVAAAPPENVLAAARMVHRLPGAQYEVAVV